jgi:cyanophycin synthetase
MLEIRQTTVYRGPNVWARMPAVLLELDIGELEDRPTNKIPGFYEHLTELLPSLYDHTCSVGRPGGFLQRLREGTWMGHVLEHVALELQNLAGAEVTRGKTRGAGERGVYHVVYQYEQEDVGVAAGRLALRQLNHLISDAEPGFDFVHDLEERVIRVAERLAYGPSTAAIVGEAVRREIPVIRLDPRRSLVQLGHGAWQKRIWATVTSTTSNTAVEIAGNKELTNRMLHEVGIPVPRSVLARSADDAVRGAERIGYPVVLKPLDGNHGRGVMINLADEAAVREAFPFAERESRNGPVIVESFLPGKDYRILVVNNQIVAVAERVPAHVVGDGTRSVAELIEATNADPRRGVGHEKILTRIVVDQQTRDVLARQGLSLEAVPEPDRFVQLKLTGNMSTGGTSIDRTDDIHPDNAQIARLAAMTVGLDVAGIDFVLPDIARSWRQGGGGIVEVNAGPGLRMHLVPSEGRSRNVAQPILDRLFPEGTQATIPIAAITGTNGKSTTARMVAAILRRKYRAVGFTSTSGVYRNDELVWKGDASGPRSARALLRDPTIDAVVLETARGGILREGLGFAACDVGAVLNVAEDHLGMDGIDSIADLAEVKSVVTEAVRKGGVAVLNGDDLETRKLARHAGGRVCFFSMRGVEALKDHLDQGGLAVTLSPQGQIVVHDGESSMPLLAASAIPATLGGKARFNIENAMAAAGIAFGMGASREDIAAGLAGFTSSFEHNPGRLNVYDEHGFRVIMDYAHNPAALRAFLEVIGEMRSRYNRVIGTVSTPGDRRTDDIREMGKIAAHAFDLLVFRELPDNRGRPAGEVVNLLQEGAIAAGADPRKIVCVRPEEQATDICLSSARAGDLVILMPTKVEETWRQMLEFRPAVAPRENIPFEAALHG